MSSSLSVLFIYLQEWYDHFCDTIWQIGRESHVVTLAIICAILILLTIQFIRYIYNSFYDSPSINELSYLRFKAAPAGYVSMYNLHIRLYYDVKNGVPHHAFY